MKARLITFLEENQLLSNNQFGFRPGLGIDDALYSTTQLIYNELDNRSKVIAIFLDLAKAFDTVNNKILQQILFSFGIILIII